MLFNLLSNMKDGLIGKLTGEYAVSQDYLNGLLAKVESPVRDVTLRIQDESAKLWLTHEDWPIELHLEPVGFVVSTGRQELRLRHVSPPKLADSATASQKLMCKMGGFLGSGITERLHQKLISTNGVRHEADGDVYIFDLATLGASDILLQPIRDKLGSALVDSVWDLALQNIEIKKVSCQPNQLLLHIACAQ